MHKTNKLPAQFCQLPLDENKASREVLQRFLHATNQTAFEKQTNLLINDDTNTVILLTDVLELSYKRCCALAAQSTEVHVFEDLVDFLRHLFSHIQAQS